MGPVSFSFAFALAIGCGGSSPARVTTTPAEPSPAAASACPMDVAGTSVTVEDLAAGGALVFVTTGDAAAVRARVAGWVEAHNAHHSAMGPLPTGDETAPAGGHDHHHGGGGGDGGGEAHAGHGAGQAGSFQTMISAHSRATAVDIDSGVRLEIITFPDQIGALRDELRGHASHLSASGCQHHAGH